MRRFTTIFMAGGLSMLLALPSFGSAQALSMPSNSVSTQSDVQQVRDTRIIRRHDTRRGNDRNYRNRHRNDHSNRTGAIIGGLAAGAIIASVLSSAGSRQSCASRYQSYRASDNTYQPYSGPRRQCVSR